jgi:uncharacterized metal-binding protein YceD (DUF177 family)
MKPELSRPIKIDSIGTAPQMLSITATGDECAGLVARFNLQAIAHLKAGVTYRSDGDDILASGTLTAAVIQSCIATGEPVPEAVEEAFTIRFVAADSAVVDEIELEERDCDVIEHDGQVVDLGEAVAQTLALALHPYPRIPNADDHLRTLGVLTEEQAGPFAALAGLKAKLGQS